MQKLAKQGVGCRPFFYPMHKQPILIDMGVINDSDYCPVSENLYEYGFYIPSGLALSEKDIKDVAMAVKKILVWFFSFREDLTAWIANFQLSLSISEHGFGLESVELLKVYLTAL